MATHLDRVKEKTRGRQTEGVFTFGDRYAKNERALREDAEREYRLEQERKRRAAEKAAYSKTKGTGNAQGGGTKAGAARDSESNRELIRREFHRAN